MWRHGTGCFDRRRFGVSSWIPASRTSDGDVFLTPNDNLHYPLPSDIDNPLNEDAVGKIRKYRADHSKRPSDSISFMTAVANTTGHLHCELVHILFFAGSSGTLFFATSTPRSNIL